MCPLGPQNLENFCIESRSSSTSAPLWYSVWRRGATRYHTLLRHHSCFSHDVIVLSPSLSQLLPASLYLPHRSFDPSIRQLSLVLHTHTHTAARWGWPFKKGVQIRERVACWGPTACSCGSFSWIMLLVFLSAEGLQLRCFQHFHTCPAKKMKGRSQRWTVCVYVCAHVLCCSFLLFFSCLFFSEVNVLLRLSYPNCPLFRCGWCCTCVSKSNFRLKSLKVEGFTLV